MKNSIILITGIILWMTLSCDPKGEPDNIGVKITIFAPGYDTTSCKVFNYDLLDYHENILSEVRLDASGKGIMQMEIPNPVFYKLGFGDKTIDIFLKPGDELTVEITGTGPETYVSFAEDEASVNDYLYKVGLMWEQINEQLPAQMYSGADRFSYALDSVNRDLTDLYHNHFDSIDLSDDLRKALKIKNEAGLLIQKQIYKLVNQHDSIPESKMLPPFRNIYADLPMQDRYFDLHISEYAMALNLFLRFKIHPSIWHGDRKKYFELREQLPVLAEQKIIEGSYPEGIKEFLLASNADHWLADVGITPAADTIYNHFIAEYRNSAYLPTLRKKYNEWVSISKGHPAPEITGISPDEDTVRLSDLKGKIVYVDVWATWCGPCKEEFPYSGSLIKEFEQNGEVAFLFVSVDKNAETWKKYLKEDNPPKGIHINELKVKQHPSVYMSYKIWGIPRYILIDRDGNIVNPLAPKPSSGRIKDLITELLQDEQAMLYN